MKPLIRIALVMLVIALTAPLISMVRAQDVVDNPNGTYFTTANLRRFQNGFMLWRGDSGSIDVFTQDGRVRSYDLSTYGDLPLPTNPPAPPDGLYTPTFGMARLWYGVLDVQQAMGWATDAAETGYQVFFQSPSFGAFFVMTLPDNSLIRVNLDGTWTAITATPTATQTNQPGAVVGASFQAFENGFMVWRADNGEIRAYIGGDAGELRIFNNAEYAALPLRTGFSAPRERLVPEGGFGRVWRNFDDIRERIGFATGSEQGYSMGLVLAGSDVIGFSLPDRRFVYGSGAAWQVASDFYAPTPLPTETATVTLAATPSSVPSAAAPLPSATAAAQSASVTVGMAYQEFERGFLLWRADTGTIYAYFPETGLLSSYEAAIYGRYPIDRSSRPPQGLILPQNGFGRVWSNFPEVRSGLGWARAVEQGYTATLTTDGDLLLTITLPGGGAVLQNMGNDVWQIIGMPVVATVTATGP